MRSLFNVDIHWLSKNQRVVELCELDAVLFSKVTSCLQMLFSLTFFMPSSQRPKAVLPTSLGAVVLSVC